MASRLLILVFALALAQSSIAEAGVAFEWVTVGDPGNPNDPLTGVTSQTPPVRGAVPYLYSISKYETTIGQYTAFLNAVAKSDPERAFSLYNEDLGHYDTIRGIARISVDGKDVYYVKNGPRSGGTSAYLPITYVSYLDAVRFANWLHNGEGDGGTETGAYSITEGQVTRVSRSGGVVTLTTAEPHSLNVGDWVVAWNGYYGSGIVRARTDTTFSLSGVGDDLPEQELQGQMIGVSARKSDARYWVPSENEWYKAAYYDPSPEGPADDYWGFPWRSDTTDGGYGNYYVVRYSATSRPEFEFQYYTYVMDVRAFGALGHYGVVSQAGNVEEWTEGDVFSGGPHTRGGWWQGSFTEGVPQAYAFRRIVSFYAPPSGVAPPEPEEPTDQGRGIRIATVANPPAGGLRNGDKIRFHPRAGHSGRMVGGVFEADTEGFDPYTVLHTITETPPDGWTEVRVDFGKARHFRYRSPDGGFGNVAEIEFYRSGAKVIAAASGTPGSWSGKNDDTFKAALDGDLSTFFDAPEPNGAYVDLDTGQGTPFGTPQGHDRLTVTGSNAIGSGDYPPGQRVRVYVSILPEGQSFAGWEGFTSILDDPTSPETYATIPGIGVDLRLNATFKPQPPGTHRLDVEGGWGDGTYPTGTMVTVSADPAPPGQQFARWVYDVAILSNPFLATTTAIVPSMDVIIGATYSTAGLTDRIRFYPRRDHTDRMIGGVFEGTHGDPVTGPYRTIYTVTSNPPLGWSEVNVSLADERFSDAPQYRYLRYRGPTDSFGNVAEIEFYRNGVKLTGVGFGTPGSWSSQGNTFDKALDGNLSTFFDASINTGAYVGIDTKGAVSNGKIRFYPRRDHTDRMIGGVFEGTNGDSVNGPYATVYTITSNPPLAWNEVSVDLKDYRYLRYRGPENSFGNVAEIEFYRDGAKVTAQSFGTPGSWYDQGGTFDKALDGNIETFFDAPTATGAYVGIGAQ